MPMKRASAGSRAHTTASGRKKGSGGAGGTGPGDGDDALVEDEARDAAIAAERVGHVDPDRPAAGRGGAGVQGQRPLGNPRAAGIGVDSVQDQAAAALLGQGAGANDPSW